MNGATSSFIVVAAGLATSTQDRGRPGWAHLGVTGSGAMDHALAGQLNRLVGNRDDAVVIETAGGLVVRAIGPLTVATTPDVAVHHLRDGATVRVDPAVGDTWGYLAVRGGFQVATVLGSGSLDSRSGIGPSAPLDGDHLVAGPPGGDVVVDHGVPPRRRSTFTVWPGPRRDWFGDEAWRVLTESPWTVTSDVSRVGLRLRGPALRRRVEGELPSEGLVAGAIQVPHDGQPIVMLRDHPTTGGYPVIGVVDPGELGDLAQAGPGSTLRFRSVPADRA